MYNLIVKLVLLLFIVIAFPRTTVAKCPRDFYKVCGKITLLGVPIKDALLIVFFDDMRGGYSAKSTENGAYEIIYHYDTYSGETDSRDPICDRKPEYITVIAIRKKTRSSRYTYYLKDLEQIPGEKGWIVPEL